METYKGLKSGYNFSPTLVKTKESKRGKKKKRWIYAPIFTLSFVCPRKTLQWIKLDKKDSLDNRILSSSPPPPFCFAFLFCWIAQQSQSLLFIDFGRLSAMKMVCRCVKAPKSGNCAQTIFAHCLKITQNVSFGFWQFLTICGIFNEILATQNVNVARFARNVLNETFSVIFKHRAFWLRKA